MWRVRKNNLLINNKDKLFVHRVHLERLLNAKTHIQNKGTETPYFMKNHLSNRELLRQKEWKRCHDNAQMFSRLMEINNSISEYSKTYRPMYCASFDRKKYDFDKIERKRNIDKENTFLFWRLVREKPFYSTSQILSSTGFEAYLKEIIKRQRTDNPNMFFVTFNQFKKNIKKNYKLKKNYSSDMLEPACLNSKTALNQTDFMSRNYNSNYGHFWGFEDKKCQGINEYKSKKTNMNPTGSTMGSTKKGKNTLNRCQSAFLRRLNKFNK